MKTDIRKVGDTLIVSLDGRLDYEIQEPLRNELGELAARIRTDSVPKKVIFDLENLEFVGSSGISSFIQMLKEFNIQTPTRPRYCNVRSEFKRVIKAFDNEEVFDFYENMERARQSFDN